jgi:hypothetical protein
MTSPTEQMRQRMKAVQEKSVAIGWFEGNTYAHSGIPVALVAYFNEVGGSRTLKNGNTVILPARAPMRKTMNEKGNTIHKRFANAINKAMNDGNVDQWFNQFGMATASDFQDTIESGDFQRNAESTIHGMILGYNADGSPRRAGYAATRKDRTFGQGKGKDTPLIDSGQLKNTLTYKVN